MADVSEMELCANCKKEIPQANYVMHTAHCARNISLCPVCKEPVPKGQLDEHKRGHGKRVANASTSTRRPEPAQKPTPPITHNHNGALPKAANGAVQKPPAANTKPSMLACKYCDLELPKLDLDGHETYCGTRTDKCIECGEFVMFKYKKLHEDSNHGFIKLSDEPGPRPSWDSNTQRQAAPSPAAEPSYARRSRLPPLQPFDMTTLYNMADYIPPSTAGRFGNSAVKNEKGESYKDMSRRLDCKTEYIKNLLHDSASITAPLRSAGTQPRNHFNHQKVGPAPQPPSRRRNPPTELSIPCEFCDTPIPHEDLIQHETGCRPDLARLNPRRRLSPDFDDDYFVAQQMRQPPSSPEVELPCEFCADMIPASQLLLHQAKCN